MVKKVSALIIVSVLFAALLCLAGCGTSSSDEATSSEGSSSESTTEEYTDSEVGFTVGLPSYWVEGDPEDVTSESYLRMTFSYEDGEDAVYIYCTAYSGYEDQSISDYSKEDIAKIFSISADDVSKKKLSSGSYYLVKRSDQEDSDDNGHAINYETIKNGYLIDLMYVSLNENEPHLSDFEDMVDTASYGKSDSTSSSDSKDSKSSSGSKDSRKSSSSKSSKSSSKSKKPDDAIDWSEASNHVGETVTVYGKVKDTDYETSSDGQPTFIDIGASYPDSSRVTAVIWGEDRSAFSSSPESYYEGKTVCVTGEIYLYEGVCDIKVTSPSQIEVLD